MSAQLKVQKTHAIINEWDKELCFALASLANEGELYISNGEEVIDLSDPELFDLDLEQGDLVEFFYTPTLSNSELVKQLIKLLEGPRLAG